MPIIFQTKDEARRQLGTVGGGNHYVDLMADENGNTWAVTHFGSRGLGHKTAAYFLQADGAKDGMMVEPLVIGARKSEGAISKHMMLDWLKERGGADTDEAPQAHKRLAEVVKTHGNTVWIVHTLSPMGEEKMGRLLSREELRRRCLRGGPGPLRAEETTLTCDKYVKPNFIAGRHNHHRRFIANELMTFAG